MRKWTGERLETFVNNETTIEHLHRYAIACDATIAKFVVDIACGEGYGANLLSKAAEKVVAIDIDKTTIENAKLKYRKTNLHFLEGDTQNIPLPDRTADTVISFETIEHLDNHDGFLSEIKRILKPDGQLIISTPERKFYSEATNYKNPYHKKELSKEELNNLLKKYFTSVDIYFQYTGDFFKITNEETSLIKRYKGDYNSLGSILNENYKFLIAVASDRHNDKIEESEFSPKEIFYTSGIQYAFKSYTYKLGNFFLSPFKLIKKILHPKK